RVALGDVHDVVDLAAADLRAVAEEDLIGQPARVAIDEPAKAIDDRAVVAAVEVLDDDLIEPARLAGVGMVHDRRQPVDDPQVAVGPPVIGHAALATLLGGGLATFGVERRLPGQVVIEDDDLLEPLAQRPSLLERADVANPGAQELLAQRRIEVAEDAPAVGDDGLAAARSRLLAVEQ